MPRIATVGDLQSISVHPYSNQPTITIDESEKLMCVTKSYITTNFLNDFDIDNSSSISSNQLVPVTSISRSIKEKCYFNLVFSKSTFPSIPTIWIYANTRMGGYTKFGPYHGDVTDEIWEGVLHVSKIEFEFYGFPPGFTLGEIHFLSKGGNSMDYFDYNSYPISPNIHKEVSIEDVNSKLSVYVPNLPQLYGTRDYYSNVTLEAFFKND